MADDALTIEELERLMRHLSSSETMKKATGIIKELTSRLAKADAVIRELKAENQALTERRTELKRELFLKQGGG